MRIIQLSDSHLSSDKPMRAQELEACISHINQMQPAPDAVVHGGDIAHDGFIEDYRTAKRLLDELSAPYFVLAGNRDNRRHLIEVFADGRHLRPDMEFVQYAIEDFEARLIVIDTVSGTSRQGRLCKLRLEHIEKMLASDTSKPTAIFLHHPPFIVDVGPYPQHFEDWSDVEALMALLEQYDHIQGLYCGHVHRSFETSIGSMEACIVSSVASDIRWDKSASSTPDLPVFRSHTITERG